MHRTLHRLPFTSLSYPNRLSYTDTRMCTSLQRRITLPVGIFKFNERRAVSLRRARNGCPSVVRRGKKRTHSTHMLPKQAPRTKFISPVVCAAPAVSHSLRSKKGSVKMPLPADAPSHNGAAPYQHHLMVSEDTCASSTEYAAAVSDTCESPGVAFDGSQLLDPPPENYVDFVSHFRNASPYIEGHRGRTFVLVIPSEVGIALNLAQVDRFLNLVRIAAELILCQRCDMTPLCTRGK